MTARLPDAALNTTQALEHVSHAWDTDIVARLTDYVAIPAKSPMFDSAWDANGLLETVVRNTAQWIESQKVAGLSVEVIRLPGRTPVLFFEVASTRSGAQPSYTSDADWPRNPTHYFWRSLIVQVLCPPALQRAAVVHGGVVPSHALMMLCR